MSIEAHGAERSVIAILMQKPDTFFSINDVLTEADFSSTAAGLVFSIVKDIILADSKNTIEPSLIYAEAERKGIDNFFTVTLNGEFVEALHKNHVNPQNLGKYVAAIKQSSIKRSLINSCDDLKNNIEEFLGSSSDMRNMVETSILDSLRAIDTGQDEIVNLSTDFEEVINTYADKDGDIGLDVGFSKWQKDIGHIRNGTITGIFASTKVGKSQFSMWTAYKTAVEQRLPVLYLDTELQARQQQMRLCGIISKIPYSEIESGDWKGSKEKIGRIKEAFKQVSGAPIFYKNIAGRSTTSVIPTIRKFVYNQLGGICTGDKPKGLVVYDYIKLMDATDMANKMQEYQLIGLLMSSLHDCASHLNIPILALGQLNKQEDIGIRRIVENVDSATILRPKKPEEIQDDGPTRGTHALEAKWSRYGPGHSFGEWVNVHFDKSCGNFREDKRRSEIVTIVEKIKEDLIENDTERLSNIRQEVDFEG